MPAPTPPALRSRVIAAYQQGQTSTVGLARRFALSQPTVSRLISRFKQTNDIAPLPHGGGRTSSIPETDHKKIAEVLKQDPSTTLKELAHMLHPKKKNRPSEWAVWRTLKKMKFSRKKKTFGADERKRPDVVKGRKQHAKAAKKIDPKRLVFLDETGVNAAMAQSMGWGPAGSRVYDSRPGGRRKNTTVIGAMRSTGLVAMRSLSGGMTKNNFISFVTRVLCPKLRRGDILVMDNLASHHAARVTKMVRLRRADVAFLPTYSPDLNPIEMLWNSLKRRFEKRFRRTVQSVGRAIGGAWRSLQSTTIAMNRPGW